MGKNKKINLSIISLFLFSIVFLLHTSCKRKTRNKFIGGTDAVSQFVETASLQSIQDIWDITSLSFKKNTQVIANTSLTGCQDFMIQQGYKNNGAPTITNTYTLDETLLDNFKGEWDFDFQDTSGLSFNVCLSSASILNTQIIYKGIMRLGNESSISLLIENTANPRLNTVLSGKASGEPFQQTMTNIVFNSLNDVVPISGNWSGKFAEGTNRFCQFSMNFSSGNSQGSVKCDSGFIYDVFINNLGEINIKQVGI